MAKDNNLTDFLTGVATAIRTKKGTTALINPQDFESEIASISTGIDISDTTATANDVLSGKVFYLPNGTKSQGVIENYGGASLNTLSTTLSKGQYGMSAVSIGNNIYLHGQNTNFELFNAETHTHRLLDASTTLSSYYSAIAAVDDKIYLFGGSGNNYIVIFDINTNSVTETKISYYNRCSGAAVGNKIYLFGGDSGSTEVNVINVFDTTNNTIFTLDVTLPTVADGIAVCAVGDKIYLFGGKNSQGTYGTVLDSINVFDTTSNTVSTLDVTLPIKMCNIGVAALDDKIYLFGGQTINIGKSDAIYEFNTSTNILSKLNAVLPSAFLGVAAASANNKIYLFGGQSSSISNIIQEFNPETSVLITTKAGATLETNGKYCISDITVRPALETKTVTINGEVYPSENFCGLEKVVVDVPNVEPVLQDKTITPTKSQQVVAPDSSYDGLSKVTVNAIPDNYIIPSGSQDITTNGTYDITDKASVVVNVPATATEEKTVDLSMASGDQIIIPTSGKNLSKVTVTKPLTLLASNIKKDINIGGVIGTLEVPTLNTPSISLSSSILTITNPSTNGNFVTAFVILAQSSSTGLKTATTTVTTFDLSNLITEAGTYSITVKARGTGFNDSEESNTVTYTLQGQTTPAISLVNGTTIQIDTIDSNAQTIEVYADGTKIGEVSKQ